MINLITPTTPLIMTGDLIIDKQSSKLYRVTSINTYVNVTLVTSLKGDPGISPTGITLTPATATQGTLTDDQLSILQANDFNYILLNNELYSLQDRSHEEGYLVYTHTGRDTAQNTFIKTITITISTLGWVLTSTQVGKSLYKADVFLSGSAYNGMVSFSIIDSSPISISSSSDVIALLNKLGYRGDSTGVLSASGEIQQGQGMWVVYGISTNNGNNFLIYVILPNGTNNKFTMDTNNLTPISYIKKIQ